MSSVDFGPYADEFRGARVCVTGASRGIGKAVAQAFAARGAKLLLIGRSDALDAAAIEMAGAEDILAIRCDVAQEPTVRAAIEDAELCWGGLDVLVNAAAILGPTGDTWRTDPVEWERALRVNLLGPYFTMRTALPGMIARKRGKIVNFAGGGAAYGYPGFSPYGTAKAGLVRLTETMALECAPHGVQVNIVAPGAIETGLLAEVRAAGGEVRTVGRMEDAVAVVLYLASSSSDGVSGRFLHARDAYLEFPPELPRDLYTLRRVEPV